MRARNFPVTMLLVVAAIACGGGGSSTRIDPPTTPPMARDTLTISNAEPPNDAVLPANLRDTVSVVLAYHLENSQRGRIVLLLTCITGGGTLGCVSAGTIGELNQSSGNFTYTLAFTPPPRSRISVSFDLIPEGATQPTASAGLHYRTS